MLPQRKSCVGVFVLSLLVIFSYFKLKNKIRCTAWRAILWDFTKLVKQGKNLI